MKNIFGKREVFSIRKFSMGVASVMIAASLLVSPQTNLHVLKAKENIEVQANKDVNISIIERNGEAVIELAATKDLTDVDVNVMLNGTRVTSYHIASIKAGEKIQKEVTKDQLEAIKQLIASGQKTLPNTAIVERSASQTINIAGDNLRVDVKYHVEDNSVPEAKPTKSVGESEQPKPEVKPDKPEGKPAPGEQPTKSVETSEQPKTEVNPEQPKPEVKPDKPEIKPAPEVKPNPEVNPEQPKPEVKPDKLEIKPAPEVKPNPEVKPEQPKPEVKPDKPEIKPAPEVKPNPEVKPEQPKPEIKPAKPEGKPAPGEQPTKTVETPEQPKPDKPDVKPIPEKHGEQPGNTSELSKPKGQEDSDKDEEVIINDPILKKLINKNLSRDRADDQKITKKELEVLKELRMRDEKGENILTTASLKDTPEFKFIQTHGIKNLLGLENAVNLEKLDLNENEISDLSPIVKLNKLTKLSLIRNRISNLQPLSELTNLEYLDLYANKIVDISPLAKLTNLKHLDLHNNNDQTGDPVHPTISGGIKDISVVKNLTKLEMLSLGSNNITDITPIKNLTNIKDLVLAGNHISDYSGLEQYIADRVAKQQEGEGSVSFAGQRINYDKTVNVSGSTVSVDSPFKGINELGEKLAKVFESDEPVNLFSEVTTNVEGVSATYNPETSKFDFTFTEEFLNKNQGKVVPINLKVGVEDYAWNVKNIKLNVAEKEKFKDKVLAAKFKGKDLTKITELINLYGVKDLSGIENLANLTKLEINGEHNDIRDISSIANLTKLEELSLENVKIKDISALSKLTNLRILNIAGPFVDPEYSDAQNPDDYLIKNIEALKNLTNLETLSIANRGITDINALSGLTKLNDVILSGNSITDISALKNLSELSNLDLTSNKNIEDISVLKDLTNLTNLWLTENKISSVEALRNLTNLKKLYINVNKISDLTPLSGLTKLTHLSLGANNIKDVTALKNLTNLTSLRAADNKITDVSNLTNLTKLTDLNLSNNSIHDFSPLNSLEKINKKRGFAKQIEEVDITNKEFTLSTAKNFDGSEISLDTNDDGTLKLYEVVNKKGKNQPKVNDETEELVPIHNQYAITQKDGKYILPDNIENGLYAVQWFKSYQQWGTFILNVHLSKETVKKPTDTVELSSTDKVVYRTLLNDWSNFNKKYKNLTDKANSEHVVNKKPTSIPKPNSEADFHVSDFEKLRVFDANGEVKLGNTSVNIPVTDELISSLENASNLEEFKVLAKKDEVRKIKDFTFLKKLTELKLFYYTNQNKTKEKVDVTNLDLTSNSKLEDVRVGQGNLQNLNFINGLNLKNLDVEDNEINDISSLRNMTSLTELHLDNNKLNNDNVSDIARLVNLKTLYLKNNKDISDINALESLKNIEALELKNMNITDLSVLKKLPNLRRLVIDGNPLDKEYMDIIKELNINTGYLGEITKEDFEWLKQYASRNTMADATLNENKQREFTFTKLPITVEVKKSQIKNGKVTIENPLKDWENSGALLDSAKDAPSGMEISEDGSNITFDVTNDEEQTYKYDINIEDYNHEFEGRPANIHGTVELKLKIVPEVKSEQPKPDEHKEEKTKKLVVDDISVTNKNQPVLDKLTFTFVNKKNTNEVIDKVVDKSVVSGVELTKDEVYTVTLNDNEKYQMDEIDVVARENEEGYTVLYNAKTNEVIESIEVQGVEKEAALGEDDIDTLNQITAKVVDSTGKAIGNAPLRLFEFDGGIPNIVKQDKTGEDGTLTFKSNQFKPNKKYELRIEKRDTAFNRENVIFNTDDDGDIVSIDNKIITADSTGIIEFKEERKNDNEIKTVKSYYKVVDENGNPVENVELSVNGIRTKITTLKNARSNKDGIVELDLEKKVNGVDYIVNVSKNDQFNWEFKPDSVNLNVSENGVITYSGSEGKYSLIDYNGTKIPVFVVKRVDLNYLKTDLTNKIKEAEEELEKAPNKELNDIVNSAKEELAKPETLPIYVKGYIDNLTTALNKIKESKVDKKTVKKGEIPEILVRNGREPELREITFEFVNKQDSTDKVEVTSSNGSLTNIELTVGAEYIIKVKGENDQVLPGSLEIKEEDGNFVPYKVGTDEFYDSIDLSE